MPAEKPLVLYERAIESSSDRGDLIVDPFCGSGTCAEACVNLSRHFLMGDIDKKMVQIARERAGLSHYLAYTVTSSLSGILGDTF
jgi:site-specific DNA-methyltransferase (adenine-specific)